MTKQIYYHNINDSLPKPLSFILQVITHILTVYYLHLFIHFNNPFRFILSSDCILLSWIFTGFFLMFIQTYTFLQKHFTLHNFIRNTFITYFFYTFYKFILP